MSKLINVYTLFLLVFAAWTAVVVNYGVFDFNK